MPEEIAQKINKDINLFKEFKLFTCKMNVTKASKTTKKNLWTFPEFKGTVNKQTSAKVVDINFPDPKFYMIGFILNNPAPSLNHSVWSSNQKDQSLSNSKIENTLRNIESFQEPPTVKHKLEAKRPKGVVQKPATMKYKLRKSLFLLPKSQIL